MLRFSLSGLLLLVGVLLCTALAGASGSTPLIGSYAVTAPAGVSLHCLGLVHEPVFSGTLSGYDQPDISVGQNSWVVNEFAQGDHPRYYVEITSGSLVGGIYDIASNNANTLTLTSSPALAGTETFVIRRHVTLGESDGLFPNGDGVSAFTDSITLLNLGNQAGDTYTFLDLGDESYWSKDGSGTNDNDVVIRPGQAFTITSPSGFTYAVGENNGPNVVKTTPTRISLTQTGVNEVERVVGPLNPVQITLSDLNDSALQTLLGNQSGTISLLTPNASNGFDLGTVYGVSSNLITIAPGYFPDGDGESVTIEPGSAFIISIAPASGDWVIPDFVP